MGCPIAEYTGKKFCKGSPYGRWYWHQNEEHGFMRKKIYCPECLKLATEMRDFMVEIVESLKAKEKEIFHAEENSKRRRTPQGQGKGKGKTTGGGRQVIGGSDEDGQRAPPVPTRSPDHVLQEVAAR